MLHNKGLVKTVKFKNPKYVGDPINAIKIFNEKEVDELIFLDIDASKKKGEPDYKLLEQIASECFMPLGYGGGISTTEQVKKILNIGFEKVLFNSSALSNQQVITDTAKIIGSQSTVVSIDVKKNWLGQKIIFSHTNLKVPNTNITDFAKIIQDLGTGEIIINSVDRDGMMCGYDIELINELVEATDIPVVACGGAGNIKHLREGIEFGKASAVAAGSMFVFHGPHKAVLINYPNQGQMESGFENKH